MSLALTVIEASAAVVAVGAVVFSAGRFAENVKANTRMVDKLGAMLDGHLNWSQQVVRDHDERFHEHDKRIEHVATRAELAHDRIDDLQSRRR